MSSTDNIKVAIKARPLIQREIVEGLEPVWRIRSNSVYQTDDVGSRFGEIYTFDHVFDQDCTNTNVYTTVVSPLVESFMEGFNATIFTYGQTSSGKTHTILGSKSEDGLFDLVVKDIFHYVSATTDKKYLIRCSYFEIYNEKINDLLEKSNQALAIREDTKGNMLLNAREAVVTNVAEVKEKMKEGNKVRRIGATGMNERSSRSHTIFRIILESKDANEEGGPVHISQLNLVDLAGSERVAQSKAAGERLKEGVNINKSLSALGNVIRQLSEGRQQFVNYRDSKLTRLLSQALGGNAKSLIIANITLVASEETKSTLEFAQRAKNVKNKPEVNILSSRDEAIQQYESMKQNLESRLKKQAELLEEMERHKEECLIEIERLKVEATIVGHFQCGVSIAQAQKPSRRHTIGEYGASSRQLYKPLSYFSPGSGSPGREMKTIHEDSFEEALAEAEAIPEEVPAHVLKRQLKSLEQSYTELKEFTKLEKQCCYAELTELREKSRSADEEIHRLTEELEKTKQLLDQQAKKDNENTETNQQYVDLQYRYEFMEQKYKTALTTFENEIENLRSQLEDVELTDSSQLKDELRAEKAKNSQLTARVYELETIINSEIDEEIDTLSAETQTEETMKSLTEMEEELQFRKELVEKLRKDIKELRCQNTEQQLKYTFEIAEMRSDNQTTANELVEENAQLQKQIEVLSNRILERENDIDELQIELDRKNKEMSVMRRLDIRTADASTEPDPLCPMDDDMEALRQELEFTRSYCRKSVEQMDEGMEALKIKHQQEINDHVLKENQLIKEKTKFEEECKDHIEDNRELVNEIQRLRSQMDVMNELLLVEREEDVVRLIDEHMEKKRKYEEELDKVAERYAEDFDSFLDAFVDCLREFRDSVQAEDRPLLDGYIDVFSDPSRDRFQILTNFLDETRGFTDLRYQKFIKKLRNMGNYWVYQQKTAKELDLRGNIHREYNNLEYLRKMRYNLDYKADSTAMIQSLENLLEESRRQHSFEIANYENQIAELLAENEKLNLEEQNQRLASQLEQLEMKLLQSGDMEVLKVKVDNLELENQSLKAILGKSRQRVAELEPLSTKVEELTQENEALKVQLSEYDTSIADLPEITKERDRLRAQVKDLKKELDNLQIENDSMRVKMNYMKDSNDANQEKIRLCIDVKKQLESQLDEVTTNYNHVSLENEGLSAKIRLLDQTIDKLKTEVKESVKTSKVLKETAAKSDDHIRNLKSQIDDLVMKHREAESKLDKVTKEARDLHRQNRQLQADLEAKPCQEQPNILKETFRRHKKKIEDLQSENNALREEIKHLQDDMEATVSQRIESYHMKLQAVEEEKMALIRKVYDLQSKVRELEAEWETKSTVSSGRIFEDLSTHTIMPVSSELKLRLDSPMQSPDMSPRELISPRELFKIKRHSLHDSRRGLTMEGEKEPVAGPSRGLTMEGEKEPVAGPSRESGRRFTQAEWDDMQEIYVKELTMKDSELFDLRANDILQGRRIKELEKEVEQLKNLVEPKGPADLLSSEPFKYNDKAARMEQIARLNAEIEILKTKLKKMEEVKRENTALNAVNEANTEHLSKLLTDLTDSKKLCSKYSQQLEAAKEELKTANDRLRIMQRSQEDCQSKMISFQSMLQSTEMQLREKEERIEQLEMDLARLETRSATPGALQLVLTTTRSTSNAKWRFSRRTKRPRNSKFRIWSCD